MTDPTIISSLNAMDATGLRAFAKEHGIKVTPLPNVKPETLRNEITAELEKREAATGLPAGVDATAEAAVTNASADAATEAAAPNEAQTATDAQSEANVPVAATQDAGADGKADAATEAAEHVETVRMVRTDIETGAEHFADVHPSEVQNFADHGYLEAPADVES